MSRFTPNTSQKSVLKGAGISVNNIIHKNGGAKKLSGGAMSTRKMFLMYFLAVMACCYATSYGAIPNIEDAVEYFFSEVLEQKQLYHREYLRNVIETIYLTYMHLGEGQSRPLACRDDRDEGYIMGSYEPRAGVDCNERVNAFGVTITSICITIMLTSLLSAGVTLNALSSNTADSSQALIENTKQNNELSKQLAGLTAVVTEQQRDLRNIMVYMFETMINEGTPQLVSDNMSSALLQRLGLPPDASGEDALAMIRQTCSTQSGNAQSLPDPLNAFTGPNRRLTSGLSGTDLVSSMPRVTAGGTRKNNYSIKSRLNVKRKNTRRYRKKR